MLTKNREKQEIIISSVHTTILKNVKDKIEKYIEEISKNFTNLDDFNRLKQENKKEFIFENTLESVIFYKLQKTLTKIISDLLYFDKNIISYGSYTAHNLDKSIIYNDIDVYASNALDMCICLMISTYLLTGYYIDILNIPYIPGYLVLKYKKNNLIDYIYMDNYTITNFLSQVIIDNKRFINPGYQMLNNFRMISEIKRLINITENKELTKKKYSILLSYFLLHNKLPKINYNSNLIKYQIIDDNKILINLAEFNNLYANKIKFKYLIVFIDEDDNLFDYIRINNIEGRFSRSFKAFLNEIYFEQEPTNITNTPTKQSNIFKLFNQTHNDYCLLFTAITTSIYYQNKNKDKKLHTISLQTILASFTEYLYLQNYDDKDYYYSLLLEMLTLEQEDILEYICVKRMKKKGVHKLLSLNNFEYKNIYFTFDTQSKYISKENFLLQYFTDNN